MGIEKKVQNADIPEANANQSYGVMDRFREGIKGSKAYKGLVGVLSGLALGYAVNMTDFSDGRVMNTASAEQAEASVCQDDYKRPSDEVLKKWMNQPVVDTLEGANVSYVNDNNYNKEVFQQDVPKHQRENVMVLFYGEDPNNPKNTGGEQGLAALARSLHKRFPNIKFCAYKIDNKEMMTETELEKLQEKYPNLKNAPAILNYKVNSLGEVEYDDGLHGGLNTVKGIRKNYMMGCNYIKNNILR